MVPGAGFEPANAAVKGRCVDRFTSRANGCEGRNCTSDLRLMGPTSYYCYHPAIYNVVVSAGIEPATQGFSVLCSTY